MENTAHEELLITRIFDSPRERVWEAWTDPEHVAKWWGPEGFTNPVCRFDLWPGGVIRIDMTGPDGKVYPMGGVFHEVDKPHCLIFTSTAFEDENGVPQLEVMNTITFEDQDGCTKLTIKAEVIKATGEAIEALKGQKEGWAQSLVKLAELLKKEDIFLGGKYPNEFINF